MPHDLKAVEDAMTTAVGQVNGTFGLAGLPVKAVQINLVFEEGDVAWATNNAVAKDMPPEIKHLLCSSLEVTAEELEGE